MGCIIGAKLECNKAGAHAAHYTHCTLHLRHAICVSPRTDEALLLVRLYALVLPPNAVHTFQISAPTTAEHAQRTRMQFHGLIETPHALCTCAVAHTKTRHTQDGNCKGNAERPTTTTTTTTPNPTGTTYCEFTRTRDQTGPGRTHTHEELFEYL